MAEIENVENEQSLSQTTTTYNCPSRHVVTDNEIIIPYMSQPQAAFQYTVLITKDGPATDELADENGMIDDNVIFDMVPAIPRTLIHNFNTPPNFDLMTTQQLYTNAMCNHVKVVGEMYHEHEMSFTIDTFRYLDPIIRHMSPFSQNNFFKHI